MLAFLGPLLGFLHVSTINLGNGIGLALGIGNPLGGNRGQSCAMRGHQPRSITAK